MPKKLLSQVERVIKEATDGQVTLFQTNALLNFTSNMFLYARRLAKEQFNMSYAHVRALEHFDEEFGKMMLARLAANMEQAQIHQDECVCSAGEWDVCEAK